MANCDIVLTTWSPSKYRMGLLADSLKSLVENTKYTHNLFVVDNGPKEQTKFFASQTFDFTHIIMDGNEGIANARNKGADAGSADYIAFVDNDIEYCDRWLTNCIKAIEQYSDRKLISVPLHSACQKSKQQDGILDNYTLWFKASGCCQVMKRDAFLDIGKWANVPRVGGNYSERAVRKGYRFIWHPKWDVKHVGAIKSWHFRDHLVDGQWVQDKNRQGAYWDYLWAKKYGQNIRKHQKLYNHIKPLLRGSVLDLGCGVTSLHDGNSKNVTGLDLSAVAIETIQNRCPDGMWIKRDIVNTNMSDSSFDSVLLISVIEHFPDYRDVLAEANRLVKQDGQIIIVVPKEHYDKDHRHPIWDRAMIESTVESVIGACDVNLVCDRWWIIRTTGE